MSFGLTESLFNFYEREGYAPVYLRQTANELTGEHSCVLLRVFSSFSRSFAAARLLGNARRAQRWLAGVLRRGLPASLHQPARLPVPRVPCAIGPPIACEEARAQRGRRDAERRLCEALNRLGDPVLPEPRRSEPSGELRAELRGLPHDSGHHSRDRAALLQPALRRFINERAAGNHPHRTRTAAQNHR